MEKATLIIEGLSKLERLSLESQLEKNKIDYQNIPEENIQAMKDLGRHYEFVSTAIIVIGITNVALKLIKIWLDNRPKKPSKPTIIVKFPDGTIFTMENGEPKMSEESAGNKIDSYTDVLESIQDVFKEFE